jgi:hypothetical protein
VRPACVTVVRYSYRRQYRVLYDIRHAIGTNRHCSQRVQHRPVSYNNTTLWITGCQTAHQHLTSCLASRPPPAPGSRIPDAIGIGIGSHTHIHTAPSAERAAGGRRSASASAKQATSSQVSTLETRVSLSGRDQRPETRDQRPEPVCICIYRHQTSPPLPFPKKAS